MNKPVIKIYTTPTCVFCEMAKEFLKEKNFKYKEYDVGKDEKAQKEMIEKSGQYGVPVIDIKGKILTGFDRTELENTLAVNLRQKTKNKKLKTKNGLRSNNHWRRPRRHGRRHLRRQKKT